MSPGAQRASAATTGRVDDLRDPPDRLGVGLRRDREARLDDVHAQRLELPGQADLLLDPHREARGLFAVSEGRVENDQPVGHRTASVRPRPVKVKVMILRLVVEYLLT